MSKSFGATGAFAVAVLLAIAPAGGAVDVKTFWDSRCSECHGAAGSFARQHLGVENGELVGRKRPVGLKQFLAQHEAGGDAADDVYRLLLAQLQTEPIYQQKCQRCHETAGEFAKASLAVKNGVVVGRENQQPIGEFLKKHGKLSADE